MPTRYASGAHARKLFVSASDKKSPDEETINTLRQWRIISDIESMPNSENISPTITSAAEGFQNSFENNSSTACNRRSARVST